MKPQDYSMRYLGVKNTFDVLTTEVVGRILQRTSSFHMPAGFFPRKAVVYSNGIFTVAIVQPPDTDDPDRIYMGVSKKCDRDEHVDLDIGIRIAIVRACKSYCASERQPDE